MRNPLEAGGFSLLRAPLRRAFRPAVRQFVRQFDAVPVCSACDPAVMSDVPLIVATVVITLLAERSYVVPRDLRRNDERIRNTDEDLRTWIEDNRILVRRDFLRIWAAEARRKSGPDYSVGRCQKVKTEVLLRYRDQLRDAERVVSDVRLSEQFPHRLWRHMIGRPVPCLISPTEKANAIADWETSGKDDLKRAEGLRAVAEQRRADAGKPPLRPLRLAEIV